MSAIWKKAVAGLAAVPLLFAVVAPATAAETAAAVPSLGLIAAYDFSDNGGVALSDASGNSNHGALVSGGSWNPGTLKFEGQNYVTLPNGLLSGKTAATVTAMAKPDTTAFGRNNFLWSLGGVGESGTGQFFVAVNSKRTVISPTNWAGEQQVPLTALKADTWQEVAVTITPNSGGRTSTLTAYLDGKQVGQKTDSTVNVADLKTHTNNLIGRSSYTGDKTFTGEISNVRIYDRALTSTEVQTIATSDADEALQESAFAAGYNALTLGNTSAVSADLTLPSDVNGVSVQWQSSNPAVVSPTGDVTFTGVDQTATLTATLTLGDLTKTKTFTVGVPAAVTSPEQAAGRLVLPYVLTAGTTLPTAVSGATLTWQSSDVALVSANGVVLGSALGLADVTLTATIKLGDRTTVKRFPVRVAEVTPAYAAGYTLPATADSATTLMNVSMHVALSTNGTAYSALNLNQGVLWAEADFAADARNGVVKQLVDPYIFRMKDGSFGVIGTQRNRGDVVDPTAVSKALFFTSPNLIDFTQATSLLDLGTTATVTKPSAEYDGSTGLYRIAWTDSTGASFVNTTSDFATVSGPVPSFASAEAAAPAIGIATARVRSAIVLTRLEADTLARRFSQVVNTTVEAPEAVVLGVGDVAPTSAELTARAKAHTAYSDGSTGEAAVLWNADDLAKVDTAKAGTYVVNGTLRTVDQVPLRTEAKADPQVFMFEGKYYFIATTENDRQRNLWLYESDTLAGLATATGVKIYSDESNLAWAPEVHEIEGALYVNWARGSVWNLVKSTVARLNDGGDPMVPADWDFANAREVIRSDGSAIQNPGITLDMSYFEVKDTWYAMWSNRPINTTLAVQTDSADLLIATINPSEPWRLTSEPVTVARPTYGWERQAEVDEAPFALIHDGKVVVTFSGAATDNSYVVGQLTADENANLLDAASWTKSNAPLLTSANVAGQYGPGHNAYFTDVDGTLITSIHAKLNGGARISGVRAVRWGAFGNLLLDMTADRQVLPSNRLTTVTIVVEAPEVEVTAQSRCVAGKVVVTSTVTNSTDGPIDAVVTSAYGNVKVKALAAGKSKSQAFTTRAASAASGTVTLTAETSTGATTATATYPALNCR